MGPVKLWCALAAGLVGLGGVLVPATLASAQIATPASLVAKSAGPPHAIRLGARPVVPSSAGQIGQLPASTPVHLEVTLKVRDQAALTSFIAGLSDRQSPLFRHFLRAGQFGAKFGPTPAQVAKVDAALRSAGLVPGPVSRDRLAIPVRTSAAAAERAFGTSLVRYRLASGRVAYANSAAPWIPAAAAPYVSGVLGLDSVNVSQSLAIRPAAPHRRIPAAARLRRPAVIAGPQPCAGASVAAEQTGSFTADGLASYYGMSPLYGLGDFGQGVHVALAEFEPDSAADVSAYLTCYGLSTTVNYVPVDGGVPSGSGSGEAALDIEDLAGLAPEATIDVYQAPNPSESEVYDVYQAIVDADTDPVVSTSWGQCEVDAGSSFIESEQALFEQAATQSQTVLAAAGDSGSTDCLGEGGADAADLAVNDPASQPYVVGVGGTSVGATSETVWNDGTTGGAGGGGISAWCMPAYQDVTSAPIPGMISSYSQPESACSGQGEAPYARQVPDVSADADPDTGYMIYYDGAWTAFGGTSAAAPLWAAVAALTDASPFCRYYGSGNAGVQPIGLYAVAGGDESYIYSGGEALSDVTSGDNDYTPSGYTGGLYPATAGYDMASGLGTPLASGYAGPGLASTFYPGLTALMCAAYGSTKDETASITGISPSAGPLKGGNTITVTGTGFLPIAGADVAYIGSRTVLASCRSATKCTVQMPRSGPGIARIQMNVEDLSTSAVNSHSRYQYAAAPRITSLSPRSGKARGGTRVTIRGINFVGALVVYFGRRPARIVSDSSRKIVVITPGAGGSGRVTVTVRAAGGTSASTASSRYRY